MIDVHLIGYTADLDHLVFDLDGESSGRYRLVVDADLLATLLEIRERSEELGKPWPGDELGEWYDEDEWDEDEDEDEVEVEAEVEEDEEAELVAAGLDVELGNLETEEGLEEEDEEDEEDVAVDEERAEPTVAGRSTPSTSGSSRRSVPTTTREPARPEPAKAPDPKLSPAQIQAMLRAGRTPQAVAKQAGTDVAWIERWIGPVLEERVRVLREARALKLSRPRLGASRSSLGDAVDRALADRHVPEDAVDWEVSRRNDGRWRVSVKFRHRNRARTASWTYDPRAGEVTAASDLAQELGFRAPMATKKRSAPKKKPAKKASAKKSTAKKATAKKSAKKATAKKSTTKKATRGG